MRPAPSRAAPAATRRRCLASTVCSDAVLMTSRCEEIAGELIADEEKTASHHDGVRRECVPHEPAACAPVAEGDEHSGQRQPLPNLDADVEAHDIGDQPVARQLELLELGGEAEAVEQAEDQ